MKRPIFFALLSTILSATYFGPSLVSSSGAAHAFEIVGLGNKCLDVFGGHDADGTHIILFQCHSGPNQQWRPGPNNQLRGLAGKCLDVFGGNVADETPIILFQCHGGINQQWSPQPNGEIRGLGNKCLDVFGGNVADGTQLILFQCHGGINQQFRFQ
jgi:Ricin-type beta-trefoil lectin domain